MKAYQAEIALHPEEELRTVESLLEKVREQGQGEILVEPFRIKALWEAEDDWDLLTILKDVQLELASWDIDFEIIKEDVFDV